MHEIKAWFQGQEMCVRSEEEFHVRIGGSASLLGARDK